MKKLIFISVALVVFLPKFLSAQQVYVCTGEYAHAYHRTQYCSGLNNCKGQVILEDVLIARTNGKKPCCKCWSNVAVGDCRDDNPTPDYSGVDATGAAYAVIGIAAVCVVGSVFILSNDVYCYPTHSFYNLPQSYDHPILGSGNGLCFGLRKTFDYSALEYGASFLKYSYRPNNSPLTRYYKIWGYHLNFVHQVLFNKTPDQLRLYVGATGNYYRSVGFGGIMGVEIALSDRLKIDVRYELSTQTNQVQFGIILKYQKQYFWQKRKQIEEP